MTRFIALSGFLAAMALSGCNTIAGAGQDIQRGGAAVQDTAEKVQQSTF